TRGNKVDSYHGAFHVPAMVRWPGYIKPNQVSDHIWAFWDFLPTVAEITGIEPPSDIDGISILPVLLGKGEQKKHEYLYWEFKQDQAVRYNKWFGHSANGEPVELYDLASDPQQVNDLSTMFPDIVEKIAEIMLKAHTPSDVWPSPGETQEEFSKRLTDNNIPERPDNVSQF
ncbi:MAG: sulfatase-like hydrolase/transferase, partial [Bacteroidetes bacterium]|nr:sulfatase-like hydrolase/transferase [Bacteroidota bacterium]